MADTSSLTLEGYGEIGKLIAGEASTALSKIALVGAASNFSTATEAVAYASLTIITSNGLSVASASVSTSVGASNTVVNCSHTFTASGADEIFGHIGINTDGDVVFAAMRYSPTISIAASETLECVFSITVDKSQT